MGVLEDTICSSAEFWTRKKMCLWQGGRLCVLWALELGVPVRSGIGEVEGVTCDHVSVGSPGGQGAS